MKMKKKNNYWKERIVANEEKAARIAASFSKQQKKYYKNAFAAITAELNNFYADAASGLVSRTSLWNYMRYQQLLDLIADKCKEIGESQLTIFDAAFDKVFEETIGRNMKDFDIQNTDFTTIKKQLLASNWSGKNYKERIWKNTNALAETLKSNIISLITIGKSPNEIKKQIMNDFNVSYNAADRLIRTESSYIYNAAALESYKQGGCNEIEFLAEADCCDECRQHSGKRYAIGTEPLIPVHPSCRCTYLPVIK